MLEASPHSVVQRAWLIDEVVRNILAHVPSVGNAKTLASCARVSSALSEPALDILWSRMTGLSPLCQLLDEDPIDETSESRPMTPTAQAAEDDDETSYPVVVSHPVIGDADWTRFTRYARRVRKLHYHCREGPSERLSQRTFAALVRRAARAGAPLLPRLEELSWLQCSRDVTPYLHFLSPSLRRVTVYVQLGPALAPQSDIGQPHNTGFLELLDAQSPEVEELSLAGIDLPASLEPLLAFKRLRSLDLGAVTSPVAVILSYCGAMPTLSSLSVDLTRSPARSAPAQTPSHDAAAPMLRGLDALRVAGAPALIEELLFEVQPGTLRSASLSVVVPEDDSEGGARCVGVLGARFATSLRVVRVQYRRAADRAPPAVRAFADYARPLLQVRGLRECTVVVEDPAPVAMTDADAHAMAEAWPALTALEVTLHPNSSVGNDAAAARPSVAALGAFARRCPELSRLRIPVGHDVSALGRIGRDAAGPEHLQEHPLRELWLSGVWFSAEESAQVAPFLQRTFPDVDLGPLVGAGVLCRENARPCSFGV